VIEISTERPSWDSLFFNMVYQIGFRSSDPSTRMGSVIVDRNNVVVSMGYNGLPRGMKHPPTDDIIWNTSLRYRWMEHAERNAIYNAARNGGILEGCALYVPWLPCMDCARAIVQTGIDEVLIHLQGEEAYKEACGGTSGNWTEEHEQTLRLFNETNVALTKVDCVTEGAKVVFRNKLFLFDSELNKFKLVGNAG
jgi:dCMP deaminase